MDQRLLSSDDTFDDDDADKINGARSTTNGRVVFGTHLGNESDDVSSSDHSTALYATVSGLYPRMHSIVAPIYDEEEEDDNDDDDDDEKALPQEEEEERIDIDDDGNGTSDGDEVEEDDDEDDCLLHSAGPEELADVVPPRLIAPRKIQIPAAVSKTRKAKTQATTAELFPATWPSWRKRVYIFVVTSRYFERFIATVVIINCIIMGLRGGDGASTPTADVISSVAYRSEYFFCGVYVSEMMSKLIAYGLVGQRSPRGYFRSPWNCLDAVIAMCALYGVVERHVTIDFTGSYFIIHATRGARLLRPLRVIGALTPLQLLVRSVATSLRPLVSVLVLYTVVSLVFAVMGVQYFQGELKYRCFQHSPDDPTNWTLVNENQVCYHSTKNFSDPSVPLPLALPYMCSGVNTSCRSYANPEGGLTSYDDTYHALTMMLYFVTLDGWSSVMTKIMDALSPVTAFYFITAVVVSGLFFLNLALVVINESFEANYQALKRKWKKKRKIASKLLKRHKRDERRKKQRAADGNNNKGPASMLSQTVSDAQPPSSHLSQTSWARRLADHHVFTMQHSASTFVHQRWFHYVTTTLVILNGLVLAVHYHGMPEEGEAVLEVLNIVFVVAFSLELLIKMIALGRQFVYKSTAYHPERPDVVTAQGHVAWWNVFDFLIVLTSVIDVLAPSQRVSLSALRCLRVLRLLEQGNGFPRLRLWLHVFHRAMRSSINLLCFIFLVLFFFALLGVQLFSGKLCGIDEQWPEDASVGRCAGTPRMNFDHVGWSLLTVFSVLVGDNWVEILFNCVHKVGELSAVYFLPLYFITNFILLNLFISIMLSAINALSAEAQQAQRKAEKEARRSGALEKSQDDSVVPQYNIHSHQRNAIAIETTSNVVVAPGHDEQQQQPQKNTHSLSFALIRQWLVAFVESRCFEGVILAAIAISTVLLAMDSPRVAPDAPIRQKLANADIIITIIFSCEAFVKIMAYGVGIRPGGYLRDPWNVLDFGIVVVSLIAFAPSVSDFLRVVKVLRVLRPLRFISLSPNLRIVVSSLVTAVPQIGSVGAITFVVWFVFSVVGLYLFAGSFYACSEESWGDQSYGGARIMEREACGAAGYHWLSFPACFDNIFRSMLTMFVVASLEGWSNIMFLAMDARGYDLAPARDRSPYMAIFFVLYITLMGYLGLNLFVGVLIESYNEEKKKSSPAAALTIAQQQWVAIYHNAMKYLEPTTSTRTLWAAGSVRARIHRLVCSPQFEYATHTIIVVNAVVLAGDYATAPAYYKTMLLWMDAVLGVLLLVEVTLRHVAVGQLVFFNYRVNRVDALLALLFIVVSVLQMSEALTNVSEVAAAINVIRSLRLVRLLRLFTASRGMRTLVRVLVLSAPPFLNVLGLLFLFLVIFTCLGMQIMYNVKRGSGPIDRNSNFETFPGSMLLLFQVAVGENWNEFMFGAMVVPPLCDEQLGECGFPVFAPIFFVVFLFLGQYVLLNVLTAVILDAFKTANGTEGCIVQSEDMARFRELWRDHSSAKGTEVAFEGMMPATSLINFIRHLGAPIAPSMEGQSYREAAEAAVRLQLPTTAGYVSQQEVLDRLLRYHYGIPLPRVVESAVLKALWSRRFVSVQQQRCLLKSAPGVQAVPVHTFMQSYAATKIQSTWRAHRARAGLSKMKRAMQAVRSAIRIKNEIKPDI
eukprot:PhM_4_TR17518/c0_g1_i1/m.51056